MFGSRSLKTMATVVTNTHPSCPQQTDQACGYLVKSGGTGVVTKDCIGFLWTCWNMSRISGLLEINSLLLQE